MGEYIDMQAEIGITKHQGGHPATRQLLEMCHIESAREVLDAGCGIGVGPAYIARNHSCHVVAIDLSPRMIEWARRRAREEGVADRVELLVADILELPFADDRFDVVVCESALAFVDDKARAIRELVRVTRPGGYVGLNEAVWVGGSHEELDGLAHDLGAEILPAATWQSLLDASGLQDRVVRLKKIDVAVEIRSRMRWIGLWWLVRAWGRAVHLYLRKPAIRQSIGAVLGGSKSLEHWHYGLYAGRKPA